MDSRKTFIIFLILQSALLLFLSVRIIALERQAYGPVVELTSAEPKSKTSGYVTPSTPVNHSPSLKEDDIRFIIREEMTAFTRQIVEAIDNGSDVNSAYEKPMALAPKMDPRDLLAVKATVTAQINSYSGQGIISPSEMSKLEHNIARLPAGERIEALKELNRAINKGLVDARF
ncbi:MAG: hypothetical protein ABJN69_05090 [Hellea sp.]